MIVMLTATEYLAAVQSIELTAQDYDQAYQSLCPATTGPPQPREQSPSDSMSDLSDEQIDSLQTYQDYLSRFATRLHAEGDVGKSLTLSPLGSHFPAYVLADEMPREPCVQTICQAPKASATSEAQLALAGVNMQDIRGQAISEYKIATTRTRKAKEDMIKVATLECSRLQSGCNAETEVIRILLTAKDTVEENMRSPNGQLCSGHSMADHMDPTKHISDCANPAVVKACRLVNQAQRLSRAVQPLDSIPIIDNIQSRVSKAKSTPERASSLDEVLNNLVQQLVARVSGATARRRGLEVELHRATRVLEGAREELLNFRSSPTER